jgi:hypothetical protein
MLGRPRAMRAHGFTLTVVSVVLAAVALGSAPGLGSRAAHAQSRDPYYLYHVKFTLRYVVNWKVTQGSDTDPCSSWSVDSGRSAVVVTDAPWEQKRKRGVVTRTDGIPGSIRFSGRSKINPLGVWATGAAVGRAKARVSRSWTQRGGANWTEGCGTKPEPWQPRPDDCGQRLALTRTATFLYGSRRRNATLQDIAGSSQGSRPALVFSFPLPKQGLYQHCEFPVDYQVPTNFAFWVGQVDLRKLRALDAGQTLPVGDVRDGDCLDDTLPGDVCTFHLELDAFITRWDGQSGTPYP